MRFVVAAVLTLGLACGEELGPRPPPPAGVTPMVGRSASPAAPDGAATDAAVAPTDAARGGDVLGVVDGPAQIADGGHSCANQQACPQGLTCCPTTTICLIDPMACPL